MHHKCLIPSVLCVLIGAPPFVQADEPKTADEVIAKYIEAIGGRKAIDAVKSMRVTAKLTMGGGMEAPMVMESKRPNKMRVEFTFQGMTAIQAYDGKIGWSIMPFAGKTEPEKMPPDQVEMFENQADMDGPLVDYKKKGHQVELMGKDEIEGSDVYKLKLTRKNGNVEYHYLDVEYFIPIKMEGKRKFQGTEIDFAVVFGDYKEVNGLLIAHSIQPQGGGMGGGSVTLEKVEMNVPMPDERFAMPEVKKAETTAKSKKEDKDDAKDQG